MIWIVQVSSVTEVEAVTALFREYAASLDLDLGFQGFSEELAGLPGDYQPPRGALLLALDDDVAVGCVGLRPLEWPRIAELKRLYVRPQGRGMALERCCRKPRCRLRALPVIAWCGSTRCPACLRPSVCTRPSASATPSHTVSTRCRAHGTWSWSSAHRTESSRIEQRVAPGGRTSGVSRRRFAAQIIRWTFGSLHPIANWVQTRMSSLSEPYGPRLGRTKACS
jgi:hypothetical protein